MTSASQTNLPPSSSAGLAKEAPILQHKRFVLFAYLLSGACSLVYQLVWYHLFVDQLGASGTTYLVVLCSFIGSIGLGAILSNQVVSFLSRLTRLQGLRIYGFIELMISLTVLILLTGLRIPLLELVGNSPYHEVLKDNLILQKPDFVYQMLKIGMAITAVGFPCFLMGLTYPYLCSVFSKDPRFPSQLYAFNTLGACTGILIAEFLGFRHFGYFPVLITALAANLLIAAGFIFGRNPLQTQNINSAQDTTPEWACLSDYPAILSGFLCGSLEALAFILIKLTYYSTKGIFALLSFHVIAGIWIASSLVHRYHPKARWMIAASWAALAWCILLWYVEPKWSYSIVMWGEGHLLFLPLYLKGVVISFIITALYVSIPYAFLAMLLPALCDAKQARNEKLARTYGLNTIAFLFGVLLFGWGLQYINPFFAARIFALTAFAGLILLSIIPWGRQIRAGRMLLPLCILIAGLPLTSNKLAMRLIGGLGGRIKNPAIYSSTPQHLFWIRENKDGIPESLMFDRHPMSAIDYGAQRYMRMMAHVPLLLHQNPTNALLICFGVGSTADAIRMHKTIKTVDVVDLNQIVYMLNHVFSAQNHHVLADPNLKLYVDDGRQFVKLTTNLYDLVTMEPPPPLNPGISRLYSKEFYDDISKRLTEGGMVTQWLPELSLTEHAVELIMNTFSQSFPHTFSFIGAGRNIILVGSNKPFDLNLFKKRLDQETLVQKDLQHYHVKGEDDFLVSIHTDPATFKQKWQDGPIIADGRSSLDTLIVSPVQLLGPESECWRFKTRLEMDHNQIRKWILSQSPCKYDDYLSAYKNITNLPIRRLILPDCYTRTTQKPTTK